MKKAGWFLVVALLLLVICSNAFAVGFKNAGVGEAYREAVKQSKIKDIQELADSCIWRSNVRDNPDVAYKQYIELFKRRTGKTFSELPKEQKSLVEKWRSKIDQMMDLMIIPVIFQYTKSPEKVINLKSKLPQTPEQVRTLMTTIDGMSKESDALTGESDDSGGMAQDPEIMSELYISLGRTFWALRELDKGKVFFNEARRSLKKTDPAYQVEKLAYIGMLMSFIDSAYGKECITEADKLVKDEPSAREAEQVLTGTCFFADLMKSAFKSQLGSIGLESLAKGDILLKPEKTPESIEAMKLLLPRSLELIASDDEGNRLSGAMAMALMQGLGMENEADQILAAIQKACKGATNRELEWAMYSAMVSNDSPKGEKLLGDYLKANNNNADEFKTVVQRLAMSMDHAIKPELAKTLENIISEYGEMAADAVLMDAMSYLLAGGDRDRLRKAADEATEKFKESLSGKMLGESGKMEHVMRDKGQLIGLYLIQGINAVGFDTPRVKDKFAQAYKLCGDEEERAQVAMQLLTAVESKLTSAPKEGESSAGGNVSF